MKIVVIGDGKVGRSIIEHVSKEGHEIIVIDKNPNVVVMGYGAYIEQYASALKELLASSPASSQMEPMLKQMFTQLEAAPVPSVLQTAWGGVTNSILFGGFFGLIIAAVQSRRPELFTPKNEE